MCRTCTTVSWSFRCFYEKVFYVDHLVIFESQLMWSICVFGQALLEYEKHKIRNGELQVPISSIQEPMAVDNQVSFQRE